MDGTVLDPHREAPIRPRVLEAVQRTLERGVGVTFASGRTWDYARRWIEQLQLKIPMVSSHGATLVAPDGTLLREQTLPDALAEELARRAHSLSEVFGFYFRHRRTGQMVIRQNRRVEPEEFYHHLLGPETRVDENFLPYLADHKVLKFVVFDQQPEAVQRWSEWAGPQAQVSRTHHLLVEGTAPGIDKGTGLRHLLDHLGLEPDQVLVIGDNYNDLPMFAVGGFSVAMGQAPDEVRRAADWVAPSFEDDGVAVTLERFILGGEPAHPDNP